MTTADVDALRVRLSNWGRWGPDDQVGALSHVRPEHRAAAAVGVRTVSCARPLPTVAAPENPSPAQHHMLGTHTEGGGADWIGVASHGYATSHLDALCHIFWDGKIYNGHPTEVVTAHGAEQLGVHHLRDGVVGRGVLLDIPPVRAVDALEPGTHTVGIVAMGLHLLDNLDLDDLAGACAEESRWTFLLTVAPLIVVGGTASPVNPIAVL